jgi:hypothetical protein
MSKILGVIFDPFVSNEKGLENIFSNKTIKFVEFISPAKNPLLLTQQLKT